MLSVLLLLFSFMLTGCKEKNGYWNEKSIEETSGKETSDKDSLNTESSAKESSDEDVSAEQEESPVIVIFDKNSGGNTFTDPVAQKIMEKTGVRIQVADPTAVPEDRLEVMLSRKEYPDMVLMGQGELVNRYIEAGAFLPLDDLIAEYGSNIQEMYGSTLEKSRYTDGHIYWLANWYGPDTDASAGVLMRKDLLAEIAGETRANSNAPFTQSEYTDILRQIRERYPQLCGHDSIPLELDEDTGNYMGTLRGMFGLKNYGITEQGELLYSAESETYHDAMLYLNALYGEKLLDKEWVILKKSQWEERLADGYVFSTWCSYWDVETVNEKLKQNVGEDAQFYCYKVVADQISSDQTTYNGRIGLGWDAIGITDNCKDPQAAIQVADFLSSEEGQYLMLWGIEGETWDLNEEGIHHPREDFLETWETAPNRTKKETGVRQWTWFIHNGTGADGTPYDLTTKYVPDEKTAFANASIPESDYWDTSIFSGLDPAGNTELGLKWQKIADIYDQYHSRIICAESEREAEIQYSKMMEEIYGMGLKECMVYIQKQYQLRMEQWNQM